MKKAFFALIGLTVLLLSTFTHSVTTHAAQDKDKNKDKKKSMYQEVYTGTIKSINGSMRSTGFNLSISGYTSDEDAQKYLGILAEGDQDDLLKVIGNLD